VIVVDTNILAHFYLEGPRTAVARHLKEKDRDWIVPLLWRYEFMNILATASRHDPSSAKMFIQTWDRIRAHLAAREMEVDHRVALTLAIQYRITAYDAQFVALAEASNTVLITEDRPLQKQFPSRALSMDHFIGSGGSFH